MDADPENRQEDLGKKHDTPRAQKSKGRSKYFAPKGKFGKDSCNCSVIVRGKQGCYNGS